MQLLTEHQGDRCTGSLSWRDRLPVPRQTTCTTQLCRVLYWKCVTKCV